MDITGMRFWFTMRSHRGCPPKNGKKSEYKNWVKILSDSYKRSILVQKKVKKWDNIEMKIKLKFSLIHIKELFYWEKLVKNGEYRNENWVKLWAQIELPQVAALYTTIISIEYGIISLLKYMECQWTDLQSLWSVKLSDNSKMLPCRTTTIDPQSKGINWTTEQHKSIN